jgi:hypothetical protein
MARILADLRGYSSLIRVNQLNPRHPRAICLNRLQHHALEVLGFRKGEQYRMIRRL